MTPAYLLRYLPTLSETFVYDELAELSRLGAPPAVWSLDPGPPGPVHPDLAPLLERCRYVPRAHRPSVLRHGPAVRSGPLREAWDRWGGRSKDLRRALWLADALARRGTAALHVHFAAEMAEVAWIVARRRGIGFGVTVHARDLYCPRPSLVEVLTEARLVVTISEANRRHLIGLGIPGLEPKLHVVRQGIPLPPLPGNRPARDGGTLRVTSVGRLVPKKGHDRLLRALAGAVDAGLDARLTLVGEGPERVRLEALVGELGLAARVSLCGGVPRDRVEGLLDRETDVFALACRVAEDGDRDGIPVALMEAMARGLAVVSTPVSGIPELVENGVTGLLADGSPGDLAVALGRLGADRDLRGRLGRGARQRVQQEHELSRQVARLHDLMTRAHGTPTGG